MKDGFTINDVYDKNLNFLFGSGASFGLFPTLSLAIKTDKDLQTIETLATSFDLTKDEKSKTALFIYYYKKCIEPVINFRFDTELTDKKKKDVIENYEIFVSNVLAVLDRKKDREKQCNIFTTNYDSCFVNAADNIIKSGSSDFSVNDGTKGFSKKYLEANNFNNFIVQAGVYNRHSTQLPQLNLIHLHGSTCWRKSGDRITVDYSQSNYSIPELDVLEEKVKEFSESLDLDGMDTFFLPIPDLTSIEIDTFWNSYKALPIVNPTKWKFHETVFEEHYYQMLRYMSYELEKPNSVLISFGFSFADEHIRNLLKRSLANPSLQLFVCCFDESEKNRIQSWFKDFRNVEYLVAENNACLTFDYFNKKIFNVGALHSQGSRFQRDVEVGE